MMILAEPADTLVPLMLTVEEPGAGGVTGLVPTVAVRRTSDGFYLDWDDNTFKSSGWVTKYGDMTEIERGHYYRNLNAAAALAVQGDRWAAEYHVSGGDDSDLIVFEDHSTVLARLPTTLVGGRMRSHVEAIDSTPRDQIADTVWDEALTGATHNAPTSAGRRLRQVSAFATTDGAVNDASPTVNSFVTNLTSAIDDFFEHQILVFETGALAGIAKTIAAYDGTTKRITLGEDAAVAPANGDLFVIIGMHVHPKESIAETVWETSLPGAFVAGSAGERLATTDDRVDASVSSRESMTDAALAHSNTHARLPVSLVGGRMRSHVEAIDATPRDQISDTVWDETLSAHLSAGSTGEALNNASDAASASAIATAVDALLTSQHGGGSWAAPRKAGEQLFFGGSMREMWVTKIGNRAKTFLIGLVRNDVLLTFTDLSGPGGSGAPLFRMRLRTEEPTESLEFTVTAYTDTLNDPPVYNAQVDFGSFTDIVPGIYIAEVNAHLDGADVDFPDDSYFLLKFLRGIE